MRTLYPLIIIFILLIGGIGYSYLQTPPKSSSNKSIVKPTGTLESKYCKPSDLESKVIFNGAAGSIYGNLTIKNVSVNKCDIIGNNFVDVNYSVKNITVNHQGDVGPETISLIPNQSAYSQIRYQNGPQCSSTIKSTTVKFNYVISDDSVVTFSNENKQKTQEITTCTNISEVSEITTWSLSTKPLF